jgi:thioredoxin 1
MIEVNNKRDFDSHLNKNKRILALFYASWCSCCRSFLPFFTENSSKQGFGLTLRVRVDDYDNPLWDEYSVEAVPTVILFEEGKVSRRLDGRLGYGLSKQDFEKWVKEGP